MSTIHGPDASDRYRSLAAHGDHSDWQRPGELAAFAFQLFEQARDILRHAVVCERIAGTSWEKLGEALGEISKQAAHERYGAAESDFRRRVLLAWLVPERAYDQLGDLADLADPDEVLTHLVRWLQAHPPQTTTSPQTKTSYRPPGYPPMTTTEQAGLVIEAASLLMGVGTHKNAELKPDQRHQAQLGLARRKVELYTELAELEPDNPQHHEVLAGARARLAELEGQHSP
ncbi:hypothetical protein [Nonomuraea dietziae]|uniref:hypothetical protein n=1 Tax=Nonomuraea dietziae TaxID=65515 RepID=UPI0034210ACD